MAKKSVAKLPSPYYILRVDRIPSSITFYQLLSRIAPYSRFIIGIARTADYRNKILGGTIYFYCTSLIDARFISQTDIRFVEDGRDAQICLIMDSVLGRASLNHLNMEERFHQPTVTTANPQPSTSTATASTSSLIPSTSKAPIPASGKDAKKAPINNWLKSKKKVLPKNVKVASKKETSQKKVELMLNSSEEEIVMVTKNKDKNLSQRETRSSRNRESQQAAGTQESEDELRLIINEEVNLSDEEEDKKNDN